MSFILAKFKDNTYDDCYMGVNLQDSLYFNYLGSLIKLLNIMIYESETESFTNIGAFSNEQLNYTLYLIKGEQSGGSTTT